MRAEKQRQEDMRAHDACERARAWAESMAMSRHDPNTQKTQELVVAAHERWAAERVNNSNDEWQFRVYGLHKTHYWFRRATGKISLTKPF